MSYPAVNEQNALGRLGIANPLLAAATIEARLGVVGPLREIPTGLVKAATAPRQVKIYHNNGQPLRNPHPKKPAHISARQWKKATKAARRKRNEGAR